MATSTRHGGGAVLVRARLLATSVACALVLGGCASPEARHEVLSFLLDGVPEPGSLEAAAQAKPMTARQRFFAEQEAKRRAAFRPPTAVTHGPYAAEHCQGCHMIANPGSRGRVQIGPKFVRPFEELCLGCHADMSAERGRAQGLAVHAPVTEGDCLTCHHPHATQRPYMLKGESDRALCMTCHAAGARGDPVGAVHRQDPEADCVGCHNPHVGRTAHLLREDLDERKRYDSDG
jgi:predicted CXXCH cytochrome family protein